MEVSDPACSITTTAKLFRPFENMQDGPLTERSYSCLASPVKRLLKHLHLGLPSGLFPSSFMTRILYPFCTSSIRATCPTNLILDLPLGQYMDYKLWSSLMCNFLQSPFTSSLLLYGGRSSKHQTSICALNRIWVPSCGDRFMHHCLLYAFIVTTGKRGRKRGVTDVVLCAYRLRSDEYVVEVLNMSGT
jgi:hypothetical protein